MNKEKYTFNKKSVSWGVLFVALVLVIAGIGSGLTRVFSGTTDTIIDNSGGWIAAYNGDNVTYYSGTGNNFESQITARNGTGDVLELPCGYIDIDDDVSFKDLTIIGKGSGGVASDGFTQINLTGNNTITIGQGGSLQHLKIYCPTTHGGTAIRVTGNDVWSKDFWGYNNVLNDIYVEKLQNDNGTAINISSYPANDVENCGVAENTFNNIQVEQFKYSIVLWAKDGAATNGYVNGNVFNGISFTNVRYGMVFEPIPGGATGGACGGNMINGFMCDPDSDSVYAIHIKGTAGINQFNGIMIWDWSGTVGSASIRVEGNDNMFSGWIAKSAGFNDTGDGNMWDLNSRETNEYIVYPNGHNDSWHLEQINDDIRDGATIYLMGGEYEMEKGMTWTKNNITIIAYNDAVFRLKDNFPDLYMFTSSYNMKWSGGVFDGNKAGQTGSHKGFWLKDNCTIEHCILKKFNNTAIDVYNSENNVINDVIIYENQEGIEIRGAAINNTVKNCVIYNNDNYGVKLDSAGSHNTIENNNIKETSFCMLVEGNDNIITKNSFTSTGNDCINFNDGNATITENVFYDGTSAIDFSSNTKYFGDSIIKNNIIKDGCSNVFIDVPTSTDILIVDNKGYNHNSLYPFYEQNTAPSVNDNCTVYWYDTDDNFMYQVVNTYGTVYYVNMTTTI